jgi:hypothetical protein
MTCIRYRQGLKYQLRAPYVIQTPIRPAHGAGTEWLTLDVDGTLTIRAGYAWDGASGPTYDSKSSMRGSLVHDGMLAPRAWLWYHAVRIFAKPAATSAESPDETAGCGC